MGQGFPHQLPVLENVTAYAALRPRDGFSHPHQEHMKDTYNLCSKVHAPLFKGGPSILDLYNLYI